MKRLKRTPSATAIAVVAAAALAVGCGTPGSDDTTSSRLCGDETRADDYVAGIAKPTEMSTYTVRIVDVLVNDVPTVPDRGDNLWTLEIVDAVGDEIDGATVEVRPWMPDHLHGTTPLSHEGRPMQDGRYEVGTFDLFMGGFWQFTVNVESNNRMDSAKFGFCVEG